MKTSFYFFLWFIVYFLIGLTGVPFLMNHAFLSAWVFVYLIGKACDKLFEPENSYQINLNRALIFEIFYNNEADKLIQIMRRRLVADTILAIYCILTVAGLVAFGAHDYFAYAIFGFFGIVSMIRSCKTFNQYRSVKENGLPQFNESMFAYDDEAYQEYSKYRAEYTAEEMAPEAPKMSKWLNCVALLFSALCFIGGLLYTIIILGYGEINFMASAMLIWSMLAIYYGMKDFISSIQLLRGKPVPTLR